MEKLVEEFGKGLGVALFTVLILYMTRFIEWLKNRNKHNISKSIKFSKTINKELLALQLESKADRAVIYLFKNGNYYVSEHPEIKAVPVFEAVADHASSIMQKMAYVSVYEFPDIYDEFDRLKGAKFYNVDSLKDKKLKALMQEKNFHSVFIYPLRRKGRTIGYLQLDYIGSAKHLIDKEKYESYGLKFEYYLR